MKRSINPLEKALILLIVSVFTVTSILAAIKHYDKKQASPLEDYTNYVIEKHNENCQYEMGECPETLCSHYHN